MGRGTRKGSLISRQLYVELHARSAFSFLEGASLPETLARMCAERGMPAMALLDRNGVSSRKFRRLRTRVATEKRYHEASGC